MIFSPVQQADTLKERYQKIGDTKRNTPIEVLCENFPGMSRSLRIKLHPICVNYNMPVDTYIHTCIPHN